MEFRRRLGEAFNRARAIERARWSLRISADSLDRAKRVRSRASRGKPSALSKYAKGSIVLAAIGLVAGVAVSHARADVIEEASTYLDVDGPVCLAHYTPSGNVAGCAGAVSYGSGVAYGTTLISPDPTAIASVDDPVASLSNEHTVETTLQYFFQISGPDSSVEADIGGTTVVDFTLDSSNSIAGVTTSGVVIGTNGSTDFGETSIEGCASHPCSTPSPGAPGAYTTGAQSVTIGQPYEFLITATATEIGGGTAYASIDPTITIDGSVQDPGAYQIALSGGVGNPAPPSSGAPEPSSWALLILGLGAVGAALRAPGRAGGRSRHWVPVTEARSNTL